MIALDKQLKISIDISLIISQKSGSQNRCFKKTKYAKFSEKRTFPKIPLDTHTFSFYTP